MGAQCTYPLGKQVAYTWMEPAAQVANDLVVRVRARRPHYE